MVLQGRERTSSGNRRRDVEFQKMQAQVRRDEEEAVGNCRATAVVRHRQYRTAEQLRAWKIAAFTVSSVDIYGRGLVNARLVDEVVQRLDYFLNAQLCPIEEQRYRDAIMERYLSFTTIRPHMLEYYLKPSNARVQLEIV